MEKTANELTELKSEASIITKEAESLNRELKALTAD